MTKPQCHENATQHEPRRDGRAVGWSCCGSLLGSLLGSLFVQFVLRSLKFNSSLARFAISQDIFSNHSCSFAIVDQTEMDCLSPH